jgi:hypothetical protein
MAVLEKLDFQPKSSLEGFFTPQDFSLPGLYPAREHDDFSKITLY